jgi:hypothetical protein
VATTSATAPSGMRDHGKIALRLKRSYGGTIEDEFGWERTAAGAFSHPLLIPRWGQRGALANLRNLDSRPSRSASGGTVIPLPAADGVFSADAKRSERAALTGYFKARSEVTR